MSDHAPLTQVTDTRFAHTEKCPLGVQDKRGREIGFVCKTAVEDYEVTGKSWGWSVAPGTYFVVTMQVTRDGTPYGACQPTKRFATPEERRAYIEKRVRQILKTAAR